MVIRLTCTKNGLLLKNGWWYKDADLNLTVGDTGDTNMGYIWCTLSENMAYNFEDGRSFSETD